MAIGDDLYFGDGISINQTINKTYHQIIFFLTYPNGFNVLYPDVDNRSAQINELISKHSLSVVQNNGKLFVSGEKADAVAFLKDHTKAVLATASTCTATDLPGSTAAPVAPDELPSKPGAAPVKPVPAPVRWVNKRVEPGRITYFFPKGEGNACMSCR